jgi:alpha-galactosidase
LLATTSVPAAPQLALTPPMGWNSWDCFGTTVTEAQTKANTDYMATNLAASGWEYIVVDIQWYEPQGRDFNYAPKPQSNIDAHGRLWPVTTKHPSATNNLGFKPLADYVHGKGLKFGIHLMRGIPKRRVGKNTPIKGTKYFARDIANTNSICAWNPDMYRRGHDQTRRAGVLRFGVRAHRVLGRGLRESGRPQPPVSSNGSGRHPPRH